MPRSKIQMSFIGNARDRAMAFARRKAGLLKKAQQLAKLCDVDVALVCVGPDGGAPVVWESDPGVVIDRYRKLPADKRVKHTHLGYINGQLSKEEGRLDKRRRQGLNKALACPGEAMLKGMSLEELLASIDAALLATAERQKALGVADDDGQQLGQVSSDVGQGRPPFVGGDELDDIQAWVDELMWDGIEPLPLDASMTTQPASGVIQYINGGNGVDTGSNHQCQAQMLVGNGENGHGQFPWHAYQPNTTVSFPDHGFQCADNNYVDMDEYSEMLMPPGNANAAYESSWDAIAGNPAYNMPPQHEHHSMGIGSFMDAGGHEHETGCLADYFQCPDASQHFGAEPEPLHYLSDMAQGISYYDDLEAGGCSSGRAQLFAQSHSCSGTPQFSGSEQSQSDVGHQYQDPGVQHFWAMEGPPGSTDVATASARARGGLYQPWISVYQ
jgi:hypothetical protein